MKAYMEWALRQEQKFKIRCPGCGSGDVEDAMVSAGLTPRFSVVSDDPDGITIAVDRAVSVDVLHALLGSGIDDAHFVEAMKHEQDVANTILQQIKAMDPMALPSWGAKDFVGLPAGHALIGIPGNHLGGVMFMVRGTKPGMGRGGKIIILLNGRDLYDVIAGNASGGAWKVIGEVNDVYFDQLLQAIDGLVG